jgi:gas vesicle protein
MDEKALERLGFFLLGAAIGAALGTALTLLFAPQSGEETRSQIALRSSELRGRAQQSGGEFMESVRHATDEWAARLQEAADGLLARHEAEPAEN